MPDFSVIMQTKLIRENAEEKLIRAINSVLGQKQKCTWELIVVCDGCQRSFDIITKEFAREFDSANPRLRLFMLDNDEAQRNTHWRSVARNVGIEQAKGAWIIYLDNDDYYTNNYLKQLCGLDPLNDWYIVDDLIYSKDWRVRKCNLTMGHCGTSNVIHKRRMKSRWPAQAHYGREDWRFINNLNAESRRYGQLDVAGYCCCHIPKQYDI